MSILKVMPEIPADALLVRPKPAEIMREMARFMSSSDAQSPCHPERREGSVVDLRSEAERKAFRPHSGRVPFSCLSKRKITKEKDTPEIAPCALRAPGSRSPAGFADGTSLCRRRTARIVRAALQVLSAGNRLDSGDPKSK